MTEVKGILLREETVDAMLALSDEQRGRLVLAFFAASGLCDAPRLDTMTQMAFVCLAPSVRRAQNEASRRRLINSENGRKGGRPSRTQNGEAAQNGKGAEGARSRKKAQGAEATEGELLPEAAPNLEDRAQGTEAAAGDAAAQSADRAESGAHTENAALGESGGLCEKAAGFSESEGFSEKATGFGKSGGLCENLNQTNPCQTKPSQAKPNQGGESTPLAPRRGERRTRRERFTPPTLEQVQAYCAEQGSGISAERFVNYYAAQGWRLSNGQPMRDWKAAVRIWENRDAASPDGRFGHRGGAPGAGEIGRSGGLGTLSAFGVTGMRLTDTEARQRHNDEVCRQVAAELAARGGF